MDVDLLEQILELPIERLQSDARLVEDLVAVLRVERLEQILLARVGEKFRSGCELREHAQLGRTHVPRQPAHSVQRALASCDMVARSRSSSTVCPGSSHG